MGRLYSPRVGDKNDPLVRRGKQGVIQLAADRLAVDAEQRQKARRLISRAYVVHEHQHLGAFSGQSEIAGRSEF